MRKIPDEVMLERRMERLARLNSFMRDDRMKPLNMGLEATHNLMAGWFENSHWRTAGYCIKKALENSWMIFSLTVTILYYKHILRLNEEQIENRLIDSNDTD